jgi:hypothetical protein
MTGIVFASLVMRCWGRWNTKFQRRWEKQSSVNEKDGRAGAPEVRDGVARKPNPLCAGVKDLPMESI